MDPLTEYLATRKGNDSIDAIVERAERAGHSINRGTVARYTSGQRAKRPPEDTLAALAAGLDADVRELRRLAGLPYGELGPWVPPSESAQLSTSQRNALAQLIRTIVQQEDTDGRDTASTSEAGATVLEIRTAPRPKKTVEKIERTAAHKGKRHTPPSSQE